MCLCLIESPRPSTYSTFGPEMDSAESNPVRRTWKAQESLLQWQEEQLELVYQRMLEAAKHMTLSDQLNFIIDQL